MSDFSVDQGGALRRVVAGATVGDRFAARLELPATAAEVAHFIAQRAAACVGADYSNLALLDDSGSSLRLFHGAFLDPAVMDRYTDVAMDAPYPIAAAVRSGQPVWLADRDAYRERFPEILDDTVAVGVHATASVPLFSADGTALGAIGFAWTEPTPFGAKVMDALCAVAHLCTETIERAQRYDDEHELIVELQRRLLPDLPQLAGIGTAARYLPAGRTSSVGGDWYEGLSLGDGKLAVVVGDVTGHGMAAAADMALIRGMITALLHSGVAVADVFSEISGVVKQRSGLLLATAALAVVDVNSQTLTFATAGHPPPLLVHPEGDVQQLDTANGPMIGLADVAPRNAGTARFAPGSQLVMFTDGLVERHDQPFDVGVRRGRDHLASSARLTPSEVIESLLDALCADQPVDDDIAIVVVENSSRS